MGIRLVGGRYVTLKVLYQLLLLVYLDYESLWVGGGQSGRRTEVLILQGVSRTEFLFHVCQMGPTRAIH